MYKVTGLLGLALYWAAGVLAIAAPFVFGFNTIIAAMGLMSDII